MPVNKIKCNRKEKAYKRIICDLLVIHRNKGSNSGRPPKLSNEFIVNRIFLVLLRGQTWKEVEVEGLCEESVIRKKYNMMVKEGIIDAAHKILFDKYKSHRRLKFLHIDSACIQNVNNSEIVDYYYKIQSKKNQRCSECSGCKACKKVVKKKKTDCKSKCKNKKDKPLCEVCESNALINRCEKCKKCLACLPFGACKNETCKSDKKCDRCHEIKKARDDAKPAVLKTRTKVENSFCKLFRSHKRLNRVYDRKKENYEGFLQMAISFMILGVMYDTQFDECDPTEDEDIDIDDIICQINAIVA